jgi:hypothetical protein
MKGIAELVTDTISCSRNEILPIQPALVFTAIALPHALYAFIWFLPHVWMRRFPKNPVDAFATAGAIGKCESQAAAAQGNPLDHPTAVQDSTHLMMFQ